MEPPRRRGKGDCSPSCHCAPPDHPRVGGEKSSLLWALSRIQGSPPRGRGKGHCTGFTDWRVGITPAWAGKRGVEKPLVCGIRITPAWAGKSREIPLHLRAAKDHPRMGGEKSVQLCERKGCPGSPPRGRGKVYAVVCDLHPFGITPAWAGKSAFRFQSQKASQDHPRVGGEKLWLK